MKTFRICLHSFVLALTNVGCIIIGFRMHKLFTHAIAVQIPLSASLCILLFVTWSMFVQHSPVKKWSLQNKTEWFWGYIAACLWSVLIFAPLHRIRWGYVTNASDILSIWGFQLPVNFLAIIVSHYFVRIDDRIVGSKPEVSKPRPVIFITNISLALVSGVLALCLGELLLQGFYKPPEIVSGWRFRGSSLEKNQLGFRGKPIEYDDDDIVIVLLGDSQVEAMACAYEWMPERRLQYHLNTTAEVAGKATKVFTLGSSGYGQDQQLLVLQEYYQTYSADLVILWQTPTNDVWNNMFPTHWPANGTPKPTFWLEDDELQGPNEVMGQHKISNIQFINLWQWGLARRNRDQQWEKYLPQAYIPMTEYGGIVQKDWQERWDANVGLMRNEGLANEKSNLALSLTPRSKRTEYGLKLSRRLLQKIEQLVTSHNGQFILFRTTGSASKRRSPDEKVYVLNGKYYRTSIKQFEANIRYMNQGFQDILIPITTNNPFVGPEDKHLNEHAVDLVMRNLAKALEAYVYGNTQG